MRAFTSVTAAVLVVIAVAVGVLAGTGGGLGPAAISGRFVEMGGPYPSSTRGLAGQITATSATGASYSTTSRPDGSWSLQVAPGDYAIRGFPQLPDGGYSTYPCTAAGVRVRVGRGQLASDVRVVCPIV